MSAMLKELPCSNYGLPHDNGNLFGARNLVSSGLRKGIETLTFSSARLKFALAETL